MFKKCRATCLSGRKSKVPTLVYYWLIDTSKKRRKTMQKNEKRGRIGPHKAPPGSTALPSEWPAPGRGLAQVTQEVTTRSGGNTGLGYSPKADLTSNRCAQWRVGWGGGSADFQAGGLGVGGLGGCPVASERNENRLRGSSGPPACCDAGTASMPPVRLQRCCDYQWNSERTERRDFRCHRPPS